MGQYFSRNTFKKLDQQKKLPRGPKSAKVYNRRQKQAGKHIRWRRNSTDFGSTWEPQKTLLEANSVPLLGN